MNGSNTNTSGDSVASVDSVAKKAGDCLTDGVMAEIARRLTVTLETSQSGQVVLSATAPTDTTKIWWKVDPITNIPVGNPMTYDATSSAWKEITSQATSGFKVVRTGTITVPAGASTQTLNFETVNTANYAAFFSPTARTGSGQWNAAPDTLTANWIIANQASNQLSVKFYAVPTGGLQYDYLLVERNT